MHKQLIKPKGYLLVHNISKKNNIGNIIRSACAFNISLTFFITNKAQNSKKMKAMKQYNFFGNQGTLKHMQFKGFQSIKQAKLYFIQNNIKVCGVQIGEGSLPIHKHPFTGDTVFFMGNQGSGLLDVHKQICDFFVYIPQYTDKTASLNVSVAAGIIFHHFAIWAQYDESPLFGQKYQLQNDNPKGQKQQKDNNEWREQEQQSVHKQQIVMKKLEKEAQNAQNEYKSKIQ